MMLEHFEDMVSGIEAKLLIEPDKPNARKKYALNIARLGKEIYSGSDHLAWCGICAPFELLNAMGLTCCFIEFVSSMLSSTGSSADFLEAAEQAGYAVDTCSYHRAALGASINGHMPLPGLMIATSTPCTGGLAVMETLARLFKKELFVLNIPLSESEKNVRYLIDQLEKMTAFVSRHTGLKLDEEALKESVIKTNQAREQMCRVLELAQHIPSPADGRILKSVGPMISLLYGKDEAVQAATAFKDELQDKIDRGESGVLNERLRLMWLQGRLQFKFPIEDILEQEYQASIVMEYLNDITWEPIDPDNPYPGIAKKMIHFFQNQNIQARIGRIQALAKAFRIDGVINPCHWGCRQATGARGLVTEGLKEIGVPVLNLEVDVIDQRNFAEGQIRTRLEAFMEMLENRPSPWS